MFCFVCVVCVVGSWMRVGLYTSVVAGVRGTL